MVDGINTINNTQANTYALKNKKVSFAPRTNPMPHDQVSFGEASNQQKTDKVQLAFLVSGSLVSIAILSQILKGYFLSGQTKNIKKAIDEAEVPNYARKKLLDEYAKIKNSFMGTEGSQTYINNVLKLNWKEPEQKIVDIDRAQKILDSEHVGLDKVKEEVISFLKVRNYNIKHGINNNGPLILCLDGPPGVGKTSIAESIAKAMEKPFERVSLAGVSQKSFIKGTESVYKGAEPGQIIKSIQNAGVPDPVILLDEIDKMGCSRENGGSADALLGVLEPKQCKNFTDEYLQMPYDISNVTFVITSNDLERLDPALRNRLSILHIAPYGAKEKMDICNFNIPRMMEASKISHENVNFTEDGKQEIVNLAKDQGARKTVENMKNVFNRVIENLETNGDNSKIVVDKDFVAKALKNMQDDSEVEIPKNMQKKMFSAKKLRNLFSSSG